MLRERKDRVNFADGRRWVRWGKRQQDFFVKIFLIREQK
jgi:hypothetical protein